MLNYYPDSKKGQSEAGNNSVLGYLSFGDGWHANHHINLTLAKHDQTKNQADLSFLMLRIFKQFGLEKSIVEYETE